MIGAVESLVRAYAREAVPRLNKFIEACREALFVGWVREIFSDKRMHSNQKGKRQLTHINRRPQ